MPHAQSTLSISKYMANKALQPTNPSGLRLSFIRYMAGGHVKYLAISVLLLMPSLLFATDLPSFPLQVPRNLVILHYSKANGKTGNSQTKEIFVSDGKRWRSEATKPHRKIAVLIFDGS